MEGQKSKWWDRLLMEIEMKVCINLPPLFIVITKLSHLPIFPDVRHLSNEEGCWCNESRHTLGLAEVSVGAWKSLWRWGGSLLGRGLRWGPGAERAAPGLGWLPATFPLHHPTQGSSQHTALPQGSHPHPSVFHGAPFCALGCSQVEHTRLAEGPSWGSLSTNALGLRIPSAFWREVSSATVCQAGCWCHTGSSACFTALFPRYWNPVKWILVKQRALFSLPFPGVMGRGGWACL